LKEDKLHFIAFKSCCRTNVLLYAFGPDDPSGRPAIARRLIAEGAIAFSIQVFQEFFVQSTHPRRRARRPPK